VTGKEAAVGRGADVSCHCFRYGKKKKKGVSRGDSRGGEKRDCSAVGGCRFGSSRLQRSYSDEKIGDTRVHKSLPVGALTRMSQRGKKGKKDPLSAKKPNDEGGKPLSSREGRMKKFEIDTLYRGERAVFRRGGGTKARSRSGGKGDRSCYL